ncbi:hypothetical protein RFI_04772 [Reticulomyxa filosa]|uniref:Uncharacterized protein n=1 Tax=Reticulomyxa filosa TaxID=46433 RepID=X6P1B5_RETFI|nr:hypothetical protein RFI_04772 [Reticulomyxa filosa]|eukprot:ETO32345.1 hypothetical protein RFI_04772 [Reticulomyxa filosa]
MQEKHANVVGSMLPFTYSLHVQLRLLQREICPSMHTYQKCKPLHFFFFLLYVVKHLVDLNDSNNDEILYEGKDNVEIVEEVIIKYYYFKLKLIYKYKLQAQQINNNKKKKEHSKIKLLQ